MHGRILIVDDIDAESDTLKSVLKNAHFQVVTSSTIAESLSIIRMDPPDLTIVNLDLVVEMGPKLISAIRRRLSSRHIPIIALTTWDPERRQLAFQMGADVTLSHPIADGLLLAQVRRLMRRGLESNLITSAWGKAANEVMTSEIGFGETPIAAIDGMDPALQKRPALLPGANHYSAKSAEAELRRCLDGQGGIALIAQNAQPQTKLAERLLAALHDRVICLDPEQALALAARTNHDAQSPLRSGPGSQDMAKALPEIFLIESDLSASGDGQSGLRLMAQLSAHISTRNASCCMIFAHEDGAQAALALDLGAADVLGAEISQNELMIRVNALLRHKRQGDQLRATMENSLRLSIIDPLTGCHNRRYALPRLQAICEEARDTRAPFAVIMADLDHFKQVNDVNGHSAGDQVLRKVAQDFSRCLRPTDLLARYGGEEFLIALPRCTPIEAEAMAEKLRRAIADTPVILANGQEISITVSMGLITGPSAQNCSGDVHALIDAADTALRHSKQSGRNRVSLAPLALRAGQAPYALRIK